MARVTANLSVQTGNKGYNFSFSKPYNVLYTDLVHLTRSTTFTSVLDITVGTRGKAILREGKFICLQNNSTQAVEIQMKYSNSNAGADPDAQNGSRSHSYTMQVLPPSQYLVIPNSIITSSEATTSLCINTATSNVVPSTDLYSDSTAKTTEGFADADDNTITFDDASGGVAHKMFFVGDLIRLDDEICRISSIVDTDGDGAFTPAHFIVDRALFGTAKADHTNNTAIRLPFFNNTKEFDKFSTVQTDGVGRYKSTSFFGLGRTASGVSSGIVRGSVKIGFYTPAYQSFGIRGDNVGHATEHGLAVSTTYTFGLSIDGSTARDIAFTTDASNKTIGAGANSLISKIQTVIDSFYNTAGDNLLEKRAYVELFNNDIRIRSGSRLTSSAVAISAPSSGSTPWAGGLFCAFGSIPLSVEPKFPADVVSVNGNEDANMAEALFDDGMGRLVSPTHSSWSGSINYSTGAITFFAYPNAHFKYSAYTGSMLGGQNTAENTLVNISARSTSAYRDATVSIVACD